MSSINKNAKGNVNTRTITWKHRDQIRDRKTPILNNTYNLTNICLSRDRKYRIVSSQAEPFIPFEKIERRLEQLPEIFDKLFIENDLVIVIYHSQKYKKEDLPWDGKIECNHTSWNFPGKWKLGVKHNTRFMMLLDNTFDVDENGKFYYPKGDNGSFEQKWNKLIFKHFFNWETDKTEYVYTYDKKHHLNYITDFLLLHELGHLYDVMEQNKKYGPEYRIINYDHLKSEANANLYVSQMNPVLETIFNKDLIHILN